MLVGPVLFAIRSTQSGCRSWIQHPSRRPRPTRAHGRPLLRARRWGETTRSFFTPSYTEPRALVVVVAGSGKNPQGIPPSRKNPRESRLESTRIKRENPTVRFAAERNPRNLTGKSTSKNLAFFAVREEIMPSPWSGGLRGERADATQS